MRTKLLLRFPADVTDHPVTYELIKRFDLKLNILKASVDANLVGTLLFDLEGDSKSLALAIEYLDEIGVESNFFENIIEIDKDECIQCGLCSSTCKVNALSYDREIMEIQFHDSKCVNCNLCIPVCPRRALSSNLQVF